MPGDRLHLAQTDNWSTPGDSGLLSNVSEPSFPFLCLGEGIFSPGALIWIPEASFAGVPGRSSTVSKAPKRPESGLVTLEPPPPSRPSVCGISTRKGEE